MSMDAPERENSSSSSVNGPSRMSADSAGNTSSPRAGAGAAETAKQTAKSAADSAKQTAKSVFGDAKSAAVDAAEQTASAIGDASASLEDAGQTNLSQATAALASKLHDFSGYLENRSIDNLFDDARRLAARNPGLFIAGGVVLGVALTRFFKASMTSSPVAMGRPQAGFRPRDDGAPDGTGNFTNYEDLHPAARGDGEGRATH